MSELPGLDCQQVVELVTDYVEGALDATTAQRVREHLVLCEGCEVYLEQMRRTADTLGRVDGSALSPQARDGLLAAFRDFHHG
jgi:anti-sigma factor RsiW